MAAIEKRTTPQVNAIGLKQKIPTASFFGLWKILSNHYEEVKARYDERSERQYRVFRPLVDEVV
jgi:hypothetical protein